MKLKYLFLAAVASAFCFAGCQKEESLSLGNIKLSESYLSIPEAGGSASMTVSSSEDWKFVVNEFWPNVATFKVDEVDGKKVTRKAKHDEFGNLTNWDDVESTTPAWLQPSVLEGHNGETVVNFTAEAVAGGREFELNIICGNNLQNFRVRQGEMTAVSATCAEVNKNGIDGKTYTVKNVTVETIENDQYGNLWVSDGTDKLYIYGTLDAKGNKKNFGSLNIEVGDVLGEISGARGEYKGTPQLVNIRVKGIKKSMLKIVTPAYVASKEGASFEVKAAFKGKGVFYEVDPSCESWVSVSNVKYVAGEPTKLDKNPADTAVFSIRVPKNTGADRSAKITFTSGSSSVPYEFTQEGSILDIDIPAFKELQSGLPGMYRLTGRIVELSVASAYNNADVTIADAAGNEILIFRMVNPDGKIDDLGLKKGDYITVVGKKGDHNGAAQMVSGYCEKLVHYSTVTIPEFVAAPVSDQMYRLTGEITNIKEISAQFKNATLTITDKDGNSILIYRFKSSATPIQDLGLKLGDILTVVGNRGEFKGSAQMVNGFYESHESAE